MTDTPVPVRVLAHVPALDGLRAVAIIGVVLSHVHIPHLVGGAVGVEVFFVLSGFLITTLLLREQGRTGRIDLLRFCARRALRLLPALVLVLVVWAGYLKTHHDVALREPTIGGLLPSLFYYANWSRFFDGYSSLGWLAPMWSLSVEEQFYVLWPTSLVLLNRSRLRVHVPVVLLSGCVLVLVFRVHDLWNLDRTYRRFGTHEIADQLLIGCLLAYLIERGSAAARGRIMVLSRRFLSVAVGYLAVIVVTLDERPPLAYHRFFYSIGLTLTALSAAVVIGYLILTPRGFLTKVLSSAPLPWIGSISYGVYLWHEFIRMLASYHNQSSSPLRLLVIVMVGSLSAASLSYYAWERPFLRLKTRLAFNEGRPARR